MIQVVCGTAFQPLRQTVLAELRTEIEQANANGREPGFLYVCAAQPLVDAVTADLLAGLPGWQGQPVTQFGSLAARILEGTDVPALIPVHARQPLLEMVLERRAAAGELSAFGKLVSAPGFAHGVAGLIAECKQASVRPAELGNALTKLGRGPRERQLAGLYEAYERALGQAGWIDPDDLLLLALSALAETDGAFLRRFQRLVLEGFDQFTPAQEAFLQVAAACVPDVTVLLPLDPDLPGPFTRAQAAAERLQALTGAEVIGADVPPLMAVPPLQHLAAQWRRSAAAPVPAADAVSVLAAASVEEERALVAQRLRHLLRTEPGWQPSDVMIVWRDGAAGAGLWHDALAQAGIPCQTLAGDLLTAVPAVRAALLALRLAVRPSAPVRELLELYKTGYAGISDWREWVAIEEAVLRIGGHVSVTEWKQRARGRRQAADSREAALLGRAARALHKLADLLRSVPSEATPARLAEHVRGLWQRLGLHQAAFAVLGGVSADSTELGASDVDPEDAVTFAARDLAGLERLDQLLSEVAAGYAAGLPRTTDKLSATRLVQGLLQAAQSDRLPAPPGQPGGVRLLPAPLAAVAEPARLVIVTGLNDGAFPKRHRPDWLLRESSRLALRDAGVRLPTGRERQAAEEYLFYQTCTRATEQLWLTWTESDQDEGALPSPYVGDVQALFVPGTVRDLRSGPLAPRPADVLAQAWTDEELRARARAEGLWPDDIDWRAAAEAARHGPSFGPFDGLLGPGARDLAARLLGPDHPWSASQLGDYAACPFRFFAGRVLRLGEIEEAGDELAPRSVGEMYHEALREFFSRHLGEALTAADLPALQAELSGIVADVCAEAEADGLLVHDLLWPFYREEMQRRLAQFLEGEIVRQERSGGQLRPVRVETAFDLAPEAIPGVGLRLVGRIDRIDQADDGRFVVYDYKLSQAPGPADARRGLDLQLPLYIEAAEALLAAGRGAGEARQTQAGAAPQPRAAGAGYIVLRRPELTGLFPAGDEDLHGRKRGLSEEEWAGLREQTLAQARGHAAAAAAGDFRVMPRRCPPQCEFRAVCRLDAERIRKKVTAAGLRLLAEPAGIGLDGAGVAGTGEAGLGAAGPAEAGASEAHPRAMTEEERA